MGYADRSPDFTTLGTHLASGASSKTSQGQRVLCTSMFDLKEYLLLRRIFQADWI